MNRATVFATGVLAACQITVAPIAAQSAAPRARSAAVFTASARSYLGIGVVDVSEERAKAVGLKEPQGAEVTSVNEDSPAAKAGLKAGDVILEFDGQRVNGNQQFVRMVQETPAGRRASLQIWRNGSKQSLTATIGSRQDRAFVFAPPSAPEAPPPPEIPDFHVQIPDLPRDLMSWRSPVLGVESEALNSQLADFFGVKEGVLVRAVTHGSAAETAGLRAGDIITKINGEAVSSPRNIATYLRKAGKDVTVTVMRNHKEMTLNVKVAESSFPREENFLRLEPESRRVL